MKIPSEITAGTSHSWLDTQTTDYLGAPVSSNTHTLTYYLRYNEVFAAVKLLAVPSGTDWLTTLTATASSTMHPGTWYFSAVAKHLTADQSIELGRGSLTLLPSLAYDTTAPSFDGRSQAKKDLDAVQAAIRTLLNGGSVKEYRIGQRSIKRYDLAELLQLEGKLKAEVVREQSASLIANGLGNPRTLYVRFR